MSIPAPPDTAPPDTAPPETAPLKLPAPRAKPAARDVARGSPRSSPEAAARGAAALARLAQKRREEADMAQVIVHGEDVLAQVLRALEVLQQPGHEDGAVGALLPPLLIATRPDEIGGGPLSAAVKTTISSTLKMAHARATWSSSCRN